MKYLLALAMLFQTVPALAHHSFAVYDMDTQIKFDGTVESVVFRNPHITMNLMTKDENGNDKLIHFVEGSPANMLVRSGMKPEMLRVGTHVIVTGSPLKDDNTRFFIRLIHLDSGDEF